MKAKLIATIITATVSAATLGNAFATENGTINFSGVVSDATCQVTGLNETINFANVSAADIADMSNHDQIEALPVTVSVQNCPSSVTAGEVTYTFTPHSGSDKDYIDMPGATVRGVAVALHDGSAYLASGATRTFDIQNGTGSQTISARLNRVTEGPTGSDAGEATAGDFSGTFNIAMDYQ